MGDLVELNVGGTQFDFSLIDSSLSKYIEYQTEEQVGLSFFQKLVVFVELNGGTVTLSLFYVN